MRPLSSSSWTQLTQRLILFLIVLTHSKRYSFFMPILPCLVSFCQAFPPLYEDVAALLLQVGQVCASDVSTKSRDNDPLLAREYPPSVTMVTKTLC